MSDIAQSVKRCNAVLLRYTANRINDLRYLGFFSFIFSQKSGSLGFGSATVFMLVYLKVPM